MRLVVDPCPFEASEHLRRALGVSRVMADVLVRRGLDDPEEARAFLALRGPQHDPLDLGDMAAACDVIEAAIADGRKIVVHGDYDVDGICATAVATAVIAALGGTVEPFLPSRFDEGYGLAVETVERLAADGCGLLVTVDCGITAVAAAARAAELGLALVITDHHRPADELPACPIVAPHGRGDYPADLCGTGVAWKLGEALVARAGADRAIVERELDLVALATVADIVPLKGENRALVRSGLEALRRTSRPGLDALMRVARCERTRIGSTEIGFRLAPRINAAGRLGHPREALELLTTTDERRARELADVLDARNRERQAVEGEILRDALALAEALPDERRAQRGLVLASPDWHVGVVGIVAARVAERLRRPTVLIALEGEEGRGSGRSLPTFDLHAGLAACSEHLLAWGGHRAAAGVTVRADAVEAFAAAFAAHADATLEDDDLVAVERMDAVVSLSDVSLDLADELAQLEPHGLGNPSVRLLVPGIELAGVATLGQEGKHLRFTARSAAGTCRTVFWGAGGDLARLSQGGRYDLNCRVERNDYNGTSSVQLTARAVLPIKPAPLVSEPCTVHGAPVARAGLHDVVRPRRAGRAGAARRHRRGPAGRLRRRRPPPAAAGRAARALALRARRRGHPGRRRLRARRRRGRPAHGRARVARGDRHRGDAGVQARGGARSTRHGRRPRHPCRPAGRARAPRVGRGRAHRRPADDRGARAAHALRRHLEDARRRPGRAGRARPRRRLGGRGAGDRGPRRRSRPAPCAASTWPAGCASTTCRPTPSAPPRTPRPCSSSADLGSAQAPCVHVGGRLSRKAPMPSCASVAAAFCAITCCVCS